MRRTKKGSLNLSINAIVVLILAIAMLGLGLGFIRGIFEKAQEGIVTVFDLTKLSNPATSSDPVKVPTEITTRAGKPVRIELSVYNSETGTVDTVTPEIVDQDTDPTHTDCKLSTGDFTPVELVATSADINPSTAVGYVALLTPGDTLQAGDIILCSIEFKGTYNSDTHPLGTGQITVVITS